MTVIACLGIICALVVVFVWILPLCILMYRLRKTSKRRKVRA